jgi:hypothetical protein
MAEVDRTGTPSISTPWPSKESLITGLLAGEVLAGGDVVYLKTSDNAWWKATGAAANEAAEAIGMVCTAASAGEAVTVARLGSGIMFGYGPVEDDTTTPIGGGALLFLSGTVAGGLADAPSTGGDIAIAWVVGDGRICLDTPPFAHAPADAEANA